LKLVERLLPSDGRTRLWVLLDPDSIPPAKVSDTAKSAEAGGADAILVGGSFLIHDRFDDLIQALKDATSLPVIIFPGSSRQISGFADGILFTSLLSGRNPQYLIGEQIQAAPIIKRLGLEVISTAYLLIESGTTTSAQFVSDTHPIPRDKPMLVAAHAQAAELFGMEAVYLEAGSGAAMPVPPEIVKVVADNTSLPVIVGGGINTVESASQAARAGARAVVIGTAVEREGSGIIKLMASAIKGLPR